MKQFFAWVKDHPFKAAGWATAFTFVATYFSTRDDLLLTFGLPIFFALVVTFAVALSRDMRKVVLVVCLLTVTPSGLRAQPDLKPAGGVAVGVVVVVVGGVAIYLLVRFCQRVFPEPPPPPPDPPEPEPAHFAASTTFQPLGSCYTPGLVPASVPRDPDVVEIAGTLTADGFRVDSLRRVESPGSMNFDEFRTALSRHGISLDEHVTGAVYYGAEGEPVGPDQTPITLDRAGQVTLRGATHTVLVEWSGDLRTWEPILKTRLPEGQPVRLIDSSGSEATFYRFTARKEGESDEPAAVEVLPGSPSGAED